MTDESDEGTDPAVGVVPFGVSATAFGLWLDAGDQLMHRMEDDRDRLADEMGVTPAQLDYFAHTVPLDYEWLARRIWEGRIARGAAKAQDAPPWMRDEIERAFGATDSGDSR